MKEKVEKTVFALRNFSGSKETLERGTKLHHFGVFNKDIHELSLPMWVSDDFELAKEYESFGVKAPYYSLFETSNAITVLNLNGLSLLEVSRAAGVMSHEEWNQVLSGALESMEIQAIVYCGREIFFGSPKELIHPISSTPTNA